MGILNRIPGVGSVKAQVDGAKRLGGWIKEGFGAMTSNSTSKTIEKCAARLEHLGAAAIPFSATAATQNGMFVQKTIFGLGKGYNVPSFDGALGPKSLTGVNAFFRDSGLTQVNTAADITGQHMAAVVRAFGEKDNLTGDPNMLNLFVGAMKETGDPELVKLAGELTPKSGALDTAPVTPVYVTSIDYSNNAPMM